VDEASEAIVVHQFAARHQPHLGRRAGQLLFEPLMRSSPMVVLDEVDQHALQMPAAEDQHVAQALAALCADEPLGDGVARGRGVHLLVSTRREGDRGEQADSWVSFCLPRSPVCRSGRKNATHGVVVARSRYSLSQSRHS